MQYPLLLRINKPLKPEFEHQQRPYLK